MWFFNTELWPSFKLGESVAEMEIYSGGDNANSSLFSHYAFDDAGVRHHDTSVFPTSSKILIKTNKQENL